MCAGGPLRHTTQPRLETDKNKTNTTLSNNICTLAGRRLRRRPANVQMFPLSCQLGKRLPWARLAAALAPTISMHSGRNRILISSPSSLGQCLNLVVMPVHACPCPAFWHGHISTKQLDLLYIRYWSRQRGGEGGQAISKISIFSPTRHGDSRCNQRQFSGQASRAIISSSVSAPWTGAPGDDGKPAGKLSGHLATAWQTWH